MSTVISEHLIQRVAQGAHPAVDVRVIAAEVADWHGRKRLKNPEGMFVTLVRKRSQQRFEADVRLSAVRGARLEKQAQFIVEVLRMASTQQLAPNVLADMLARAQATGVGHVSSRVIERLRKMGARWPK